MCCFSGSTKHDGAEQAVLARLLHYQLIKTTLQGLVY